MSVLTRATAVALLDNAMDTWTDFKDVSTG